MHRLFIYSQYNFVSPLPGRASEPVFRRPAPILPAPHAARPFHPPSAHGIGAATYWHPAGHGHGGSRSFVVQAAAATVGLRGRTERHRGGRRRCGQAAKSCERHRPRRADSRARVLGTPAQLGRHVTHDPRGDQPRKTDRTGIGKLEQVPATAVERPANRVRHRRRPRVHGYRTAASAGPSITASVPPPPPPANCGTRRIMI